MFDFYDYKSYLVFKTNERKGKRGVKSAIAQAIGCQPTYISQVIKRDAHLSLEQADKINIFFGHTEVESKYFLLLVQKDKAGTLSLKEFLKKQLNDLRSQQLVLTQRLGQKKSLSSIDQSIYYSSWQYAAVHIALTISNLKNKEALSKFFNISLKRISAILEFLIKIGLVSKSNNSYNVDNFEVRLGKNSQNIIKHHTNLRNQAIESLEREDLSDLHYSSVISLSAKDTRKIKNIILDRLQSDLKIIKHSSEEKLYCYNIDFFSLKKNVI